MRMNRDINMIKAVKSVLLAFCMPVLLFVGCIGDDAPELSQPLKPIFMYNDSLTVMPVDIQTRADMFTDPSLTVGLYLTPSRATTLYSFTYNTPVWDGNANVDAGINYDIFGYLPVKPGITATLTGFRTSEQFDNTTYQPMLTLSNMDPILTDELAIVTGVRSINAGTDAEAETNAAVPTPGYFYYEGKASSNYVCLLMERIVSCYDIKISVSSNTVPNSDIRYDAMNYAGIRTIKVKKMEVTTSAASKMTATVTLNDNPTGVTKAIESVAWSTESGSSGPIAIFDSENAGAEKVLTTEWQEVAFYSMPASLQNVTLKTTYDVYDRKGNLVRKDCEVYNNLTSLLSSITPQAGYKYTLNLVVKPTYLYHLSDGDIDNPTIVATTTP